MSFNPKQEYAIIPTKIHIAKFHKYTKKYVTRPPYQRKNVWTVKKKQALMDSLLRRYYVPKLVLREVRLSDNESIYEVIDGQQRIITVQDFFLNRYNLPESLNDIHKDLGGSYFKDLSDDIREFIEEEIMFEIDMISNIDNPKDKNHQKIATVIFSRLQEGENLNYMEKAHAKLSSLTRNVIVKYSDDITFDYDKYLPVDKNPDKLKFFSLLKQDNNRMDHMKYFARLLMIEQANGYTELKDIEIEEYISKYENDDGIGNYNHANETYVKKCISNLNLFHDIFKDDPMLKDNSKLMELNTEYIIVSFYLLLRHLKEYYVIDDNEKVLFREFLIKFHEQWRINDSNDLDIQIFRNNRQQSRNNLEIRDMILRQFLFDYLKNNNKELLTKDERRAFNESERIRIYRKSNGMCVECIAEGKSDKESQVGWNEYQADHVIPHSKGGDTILENAQLLCRIHNQRKSNKIILKNSK